MNGYVNKERVIAFFFTLVFVVTNLIPIQVWALTSGPTQPEMSSFQPAGVSDMVDVFSGDFKYNIPLLDVDGYPVNLSYQSGVGVDDEASWVGLGWNINVGSVNRQLRGLPDDFSGDLVTQEFSQKPKVTIGGSVYVKPELIGKLKMLSGKVELGIFNDNYTGIGASIGANAGISIGLTNGSGGTPGLGLNGGLGITSSTSSGVDVSPSVSLSLKNTINNNLTTSMGVSAGLGYNTRSGLKALTLSQSFSVNSSWKDKRNHDQYGSSSLDLGGSSFIYNTEPFYPKSQLSYETGSVTFTPNIGPGAYGVYVGVGGTGYVNVRQIKEEIVKKPAYGFLYADRGKNRPDALMDFTREKDNPIISELPNLAVPVHSPDLFAFSSQTGAGQFRLYRSTGILSDDEAKDESKAQTAGFDIGFGAYFHGGVSYYEQNVTAATRKWTTQNDYRTKGDFQDNSGINPKEDAVFFKQVGEKVEGDKAIDDAIRGEEPVAVAISGRSAQSSFYQKGQLSTIGSNIKREEKAKKRAVISYLTATEAEKGGLEKTLSNYTLLTSANPLSTSKTPLPRKRIFENSSNNNHHISEFTVTDEAGKRMVYGLPVYNTKQEEYTFAVNSAVNTTTNQVSFDLNGDKVNTRGKGLDWYYSKQIQPAYVTSHLLTGILSADYVDVKGDGITDDDRGSAIKFNYSRIPYPIRWRTPVSEEKQANYNKGLLADPEDEKGSIVYGEKEQWYLHSIETKTKVAFFVLEARRDALGATSWLGGVDGSNQLMRLKEIRLYSKADMSKPIKTVFLQHSYQLCKGVPNHLDNINSTSKIGGKLTLDAIYFTYGNSPKGVNHKYLFDYKNTADYAYIASDRWGTYKKPGSNTISLANDEFPYTLQDKALADDFSSQWLLKEIKLPTGGIIQVNYESDDYAYVQNKRAMKMVPLYGNGGRLVDANDKDANLINAKKILLTLPEGLPAGIPLDDHEAQSRWFKNTYLNGEEYIYGKLYVKIARGSDKINVPGHQFDFVSCYAKVKQVQVTGNNASIEMEDISDGGVSVNPFCIAAWQKMRMEYPKYAYPGYENRPDQSNALGNFKATISAIFNAYKTLGELKGSFNQRAARNRFASSVDITKSFIRLADVSGKKLGGGCRVKRIAISDGWAGMVNTNNGTTAIYGMEYDYTTTENGRVISSGVASYEPTLGNDENPLHQPVPYLQRIKGAVNNLFSLERPFGESYFPAASVGYSKVTVRNIDASGNANATNGTGWTVSEFYTAKEFPVIVAETSVQKSENGPRSNSNLFGGMQVHELTLSQGYTIHVNDMHGKQKAEKIYDQSGALLSSSDYEYFASPINVGEWKLNNEVKTISDKGLVADKILGREIELFTDMRESEYSNFGTSINLGSDIFPIPIIPPITAVIPHWPTKSNDEYRLFRSACIAKVVQTYGIVKKVIKMQSGSIVTAENIAFDASTGDVLVTKTHNEHKKPVYTVNVPAYWIHNGMGGAYQTTGTIITNFKTNINGVVDESSYSSFLKPGDELLTQSRATLWVIYNKEVVNDTEATNPSMRVIDRKGNLVKDFKGWVKVIRSGNRNMISASATSIVCMDNPIQNNQLQVIKDVELKDWKVIDAKATIFSEDWTGESDLNCKTCPVGYIRSKDGQWCEVLPEENNSKCFDVGSGSINVETYNIDGAFIQEMSGSTPYQIRSAYWGEINCNTCNYPLNRSGIWICNDYKGGNNNKWMGLETYVIAPEEKTYYVGYSADEGIRLSIEGKNIVSINNDVSLQKKWMVVPITLKKGKNHLKLEMMNTSKTGEFDVTVSVGVEIYNNTYQQLLNAAADGSNINRIFSTSQLINIYNKNRVYTYFINADGSILPRYYCEDGRKPDILNDVTCTRSRFDLIINPYIKGIKGNWRPSQSKVFQVNRSYANQTVVHQSGINAEKDGHYQNFTPYHVVKNGQWKQGTVNADKWVTATTMTLYDKWGQELENKDALNRYSAASFSFLGNTPAAVASNAQHREIFYESFEDLKFRSAYKSKYVECDTLSFNFDSYHNNVISSESHSGRYALNITNTLTLSGILHNITYPSAPYLAINQEGEYLYKNVPGLYTNGFQPVPGKTYLLSFWVKGGGKFDKTSPLTINVNGIPVALQWKATVEGWKLMEGVFTPTGNDLNLSINGTGLLDDLRIVPNDGQIKTFAYDERNFRLMAELDENNFATFYEYDEEGILNRVKKETERGIMTIKETRSTYKKTN